MPQPRKRPPTGPARYIQHYEQYGHADPGVFPLVARDEEHERAAARAQHDFIRQVNHQMARLDLDAPTIADQVGLGTEQFRRYLRGETELSLPLIHRIASAVAINVVHTFEATE